MKIVILLAFIAIFISLGSALVFMMRDKSGSNRMVNALTWRIGLSVLLFLFILFSWWMGWVEPSGITLQQR